MAGLGLRVVGGPEEIPSPFLPPPASLPWWCWQPLQRPWCVHGRHEWQWAVSVPRKVYRDGV